MKIIIFHGSFGNPQENWISDLKQKLVQIGQDVIVPQFPVEDWDKMTMIGPDGIFNNQNLKNWIRVFSDIKSNILTNEPLCFIGHSIGPLFILHIVESFNIQLDSAIFVCPFLEKLNKSWQIDSVNNSFYKKDFDFTKLKKLIPVSYSLFTNNDPYVDPKYAREFAQLMDSNLIEIKNGGHLGETAGFKKFPLLVDLCYSRIEPSIYLNSYT
jgi:predicted alpha/beta hydrolase family esterase